MPAVDLSYLSWNPCILSHGPHYDDPWRYNCNDSESIKGVSFGSTRKSMLLYDSKTLEISDHASLAMAASSISADPGQIRQSAQNGWLIAKRYIAGYTIAQLFDNMKKHGWE